MKSIRGRYEAWLQYVQTVSKLGSLMIWPSYGSKLSSVEVRDYRMCNKVALRQPQIDIVGI